jgi:hypothetical protein
VAVVKVKETKAICHPNRKRVARGLCKLCLARESRREQRKMGDRRGQR